MVPPDGAGTHGAAVSVGTNTHDGIVLASAADGCVGCDSMGLMVLVALKVKHLVLYKLNSDTGAR
jgi:hypothetical protein